MKKIYILAPIFLLLTTACLGGGSTSQEPDPTGFYVSNDRGSVWEYKSSVYSLGGENRTFAGSSITAMELDPSNGSTIYLGTNNAGLLYSLDGGNGWFSSTPGSGVVNAVAADPADTCIVYAAVHNKVYKTTDCTRNWELVHLSSLENEFFTSLDIDPVNTRFVYLGTSRGTVIRSSDAGFSWQATKFLPSRVTKIIVNPKNTNIVYTATASSGIFKSEDNGTTWENLLELEVQTANEEISGNDRPLEDFRAANSYLNFAFDYTQNDGLIYSNNYGIFRLFDDGYWQEIVILNKPREEDVISIDINPLNGSEIFFATTGAFYQTANNGVDWTVRPLPSAGKPNYLRVNPDNGNTIYIGYQAAS